MKSRRLKLGKETLRVLRRDILDHAVGAITHLSYCAQPCLSQKPCPILFTLDHCPGPAGLPSGHGTNCLNSLECPSHGLGCGF